MVLRESQFSQRAAEETLPLRDAFAVLFFVSVGMLFDPRVLIDEPLQVLAVVAIIVLGKSLAAAGAGAAVPLPAEHRAVGVGQPGADRRVLVHPGGAGPVAGRAAARRARA